MTPIYKEGAENILRLAVATAGGTLPLSESHAMMGTYRKLPLRIEYHGHDQQYVVTANQRIPEAPALTWQRIFRGAGCE